MAGHGGPRPNSGRKSRADEMELQSKLDPMEPDFLQAFHKAIKAGNPVALKLFADYRYGKPTEHIDHTTDGDKLPDGSKHEIIFRDYSNKNDQP